MADEKIGISVEVKGTGAGIKSVKELKNEVQKLEETASKADFGSDEFKKATEEANKLKGKMTEISGAESTKMTTSLKGLQQEYKKLKVALSEAANPEEFKRLSKELNDVEGKIGDINDAASIATGSGVEQLNKGIALVGEGFRNFDFEKIKIGFKGIGQAMSAAGPLLLVAAIGALIENFDKVKAVVVGLFPALDSVSASTKALEKQQLLLVESNKILIADMENSLSILKATGASTKEIYEEEKKLIETKVAALKVDAAVLQSKLADIKTNDSLWESILRVGLEIAKAAGLTSLAEQQEKALAINKAERAKEFTDKLLENNIAIGKAETELALLKINFDKKEEEDNKTKAANAEKRRQDELKKIGEANKAKEEAIKQHSANSRNLLAEEQAADTAAKKKKADDDLKIQIAAFDAEVAAKKKAEDDKKKLEEQTKNGQAKLFEASFNAAKGLSDAIFAIQIGNAKKGSAEELKLKKQQFNVNKAFSVTQATIDGVKAVQGVLAQSAFYGPFTVPIAIATGISAAANVAKIAAAKFDGGGASSGGGGGGAAPQIGSTSLPTPPTINNPNNNTSTMFDAQGNNLGQSNEQRTSQQPIKVFVTETDISDIQNRANKLKTQTTI
jgi:hypothetical protein